MWRTPQLAIPEGVLKHSAHEYETILIAYEERLGIIPPDYLDTCIELAKVYLIRNASPRVLKLLQEAGSSVASVAMYLDFYKRIPCPDISLRFLVIA